MRSSNLFSVFFMICIMGFSELAAQQYTDGPIELRVRYREVETNFNPTDAAVLGVGFNPDELTYKVWARDNGNFDGQNWHSMGGQCRTQNFDPPGASNDFNTIVMDHTYTGATVPQFFDVRVDMWEDDSDDVGCGGSRCNWESSFCCGVVVFGSCVGVTTGDDNRCNADPFITGMDYRLGSPCSWYDHGRVTGACGNTYKPRIESYWRYTKGTACNDPIVLGNLPALGTLNHFNSTACYANAFSASPGNDVFYEFTISAPTGVNISLCGAGTNFNSVLYLLDNSCNQIASNDNSCGNISEIATNICTPGTYKVVVDGATGSSQGTFSLTITDDPSSILTVNVAGTDVNCSGGADGTATANEVGGTAPFTYAWTPNVGNTKTVTGLSPGSYSVVVTDGTGCTASGSVTINAPTAIAVSTTVTSPTCNGGNDGQMTVTASGGNPPYQYSKDGGNVYQNNNTITGLDADTYILVVKDDNDCTDTSMVVVVDPPAILPNLTVSNISCNGANDGSVASTPTNGTPPYLYSLDAGPFVSDSAFTGIASGFHTLTVRDADGCEGSAGFNIFEPTTLSSLITSTTNVSCNGVSDGGFTITGQGGTLPYSYSVDGTNFQSSGTFTGLAANTYNVFVRDSNDCQVTNNVVVNEPPPLVLSLLLQFSVSCTGASDGAVAVIASGGVGPYQYSTDGIFYRPQNFYDNLSAGTYTYYVLDNNGCGDTITVTLNNPTPLALAVGSSTDASCLGIADGSITLSGSGGTPPYSYSIDGGASQPDSTFNGLDAGTYQFTIEDFNGCLFTQSFTIGFVTTINVSISNLVNIACNGDSTGRFMATASNGSAPYTYSIDGTNFQSSGTFTDLPAGNYDLTAMDVNGCLAIEPVSITQPNALMVSLVQTTPASCFNTTDGTLEIAVSGGVQPYTFDWSNDSTTQNLINVGGGTYTVDVTDDNGCVSSLTATVGQSPPIYIDIESTKNVSCNGDDDGEIDVKVFGGAPPYSYTWSNNANTEDLIDLTAGNYSITVADANGCSLTESYDILQPNGIFPNIDSTKDVTCADGENGQIYLSTIGGQPPFSYSVNGVSFQVSPVITGLSAGNYTVIIKDSEDCTESISTSISETGSEIFFSYGGDYEIFQGQTIELSPVILPDNLVIDTVIWTPQTGLSCTNCTNPMANPTEDIVYTVTLRDINGCEATTVVRVKVSDEVSIQIPNVFSPNDDNTNDRFSFYAYGILNAEVRIFDRWGSQVYYNANQIPNTDADGWDGAYNGTKAQTGTYIYLINFILDNPERDEVQQTGSITLLR